MKTINWIKPSKLPSRPAHMSEKTFNAFITSGICENGEFYVCYHLANENEEKVFWMAARDGISIARYEGALFVPLSWVLREFMKGEEREAFIKVRDETIAQYRKQYGHESECAA